MLTHTLIYVYTCMYVYTHVVLYAIHDQSCQNLTFDRFTFLIKTIHSERNCFYVYALIGSATVLLAALLLVSALVAGLLCAIRHARRANTPQQSGENGTIQHKYSTVQYVCNRLLNNYIC